MLLSTFSIIQLSVLVLLPIFRHSGRADLVWVWEEMAGSVWDMLSLSFLHISVDSWEDSREMILQFRIRELGLSYNFGESSTGRWWIIPLSYFFKFIWFIYFWLCWVFVAAHGLTLVAGSGAYSSLGCTAFSLQCFSCCRARALGVRASVVVACEL